MLIKKNEYLDLPRSKVKCYRHITLPESTDVVVQVKWDFKENYLELGILLQQRESLKECEVDFLVTFPLQGVPSGGPDFSALAVSGCGIWEAVDVSLQHLVTKITKKLKIFFESPMATFGGTFPNEPVTFSLEVGGEVLEGESTIEKLKGFLVFE